MIIVLYRPEIPQNTGNIIRTCSVTGTKLILVSPLGFSVSDRSLKRAGLDYAKEVNMQVIDNLEEYLLNTKAPFTFYSSKATVNYTEVTYKEDHIFIFGSETKGLDPSFKEKYPENFATIPMKKEARCLNLSNAASIVLYEGLRQTGFSFSPKNPC